jgi:glucokinase
MKRLERKMQRYQLSNKKWVMSKKTDQTVIGVDLGGTKILASQVEKEQVLQSRKVGVPQGGSEVAVLEAIYEAIDPLFSTKIAGIGVGVPSVVDVERGIVYDVQNIPSWKEVPLKKILEARYKVPVYLNNDANCFAIGEQYFGEGRNYANFVALIIGTGIAGGLVLHDQLYNGFNGGAGEFGMLPYLDQHLEYYCSGQFFQNVHQTEGPLVYEQAKAGDPAALAMFEELGNHIGHAIKAVLYTLDPDVIILGGSVAQAYPFFEKSLWQAVRTLAYSSVVSRLEIKLSTNPEIAVLGAAALCYDAFKNKI